MYPPVGDDWVRGPNSGKTGFSCHLIRHLVRRYPVHAVKVTTIYDDRESCVRGGSGCGVCTSMDCECRLDEEYDTAGTKDTSRLLAAGAHRVWWLRVRERSLNDAALELSRLAPAGGVLVIESNSVRRVVEPDLLFMMGEPGTGKMKESAAGILHLADRVVAFNGTDYDVDPDRVGLLFGRCQFRHDAGAVVLAGGRSSRMGTDKRLLDIGGLPLVEHVCRQLDGTFAEILLSVGESPGPVPAGTRTVSDRYGDAGPLGGIASALQQARFDVNFVVACDIPTVPIRLVQLLLRRAREYEVVVPVDQSNQYEPLFAVYNRSVLPAALRLLGRGERQVRRLFDEVHTCHVPVPGGADLRNLNTPDEYQAYLTG